LAQLARIVVSLADGRCIWYRVLVVGGVCYAMCFTAQVHAVIGVLGDDTDPMVTVMKLEKAPQETYADIGGLDNQIQEIKVRTIPHRNPPPLYACGTKNY